MKIPLLIQVLLAVVLGLLLGNLLPTQAIRGFITFNSLFTEYLNFCIPLIILALITAGISGLGKQSGKLVIITVMIAYGSTLFSGYYTYFTCAFTYPQLLTGTIIDTANADQSLWVPYFTLQLPPVFGVMTALVLSFILGIGIATSNSQTLKNAFDEFQNIISKAIQYTIVPFLPLFIFGIFLKMTAVGEATQTLSVFGKVIGIVFFLHITLLLIQYISAGLYIRRNPFPLLWNMLPAYFTALGTSSSAVTIPVTLRQVMLNGVREPIAQFCVPLCATIHIAGSMMKITAFAMAVYYMTSHALTLSALTPFILLLSIMMVAAPGVPGGGIMAATTILQSILGFTPENVGAMITLYIVTDSFGTACNVCGDGAIAVVINKIAGNNQEQCISHVNNN